MLLLGAQISSNKIDSIYQLPILYERRNKINVYENTKMFINLKCTNVFCNIKINIFL